MWIKYDKEKNKILIASMGHGEKEIDTDKWYHVVEVDKGDCSDLYIDGEEQK